MNGFTKLSSSEIDIPWMIRRHMDEVLEIEMQCFPLPWSEEEFIRCLRNRNAIGMVAKAEERVVGFMVYELHRNLLHILNFAVRPSFQRRGVGTAMVNKLIGKLSSERRNRLMLEICETNLNAQLFFRAKGFRAVSVLKDFYEDAPGEAAYLFQYRYAAEACNGR